MGYTKIEKLISYSKDAEIADLCELKINLTHHIARKTFATAVLLLNDVPMEIVSKLLGHSRISITQTHYGQILEEKVEEEMERLSTVLEIKNKGDLL